MGTERLAFTRPSRHRNEDVLAHRYRKIFGTLLIAIARFYFPLQSSHEMNSAVMGWDGRAVEAHRALFRLHRREKTMSLKGALTTFILVVISLAIVNRVSFLKTITG